jgi:uncharacterized protein (TIGR02145 family)
MKHLLLPRSLQLLCLFCILDRTPAIAQSVTDIDGNEYPTVVIGMHEWIAENLRTTRYNNGDVIPHVVDNGTWATTQEGAWSWYGHNEGYDPLYGKLYNGHVVLDERNVCPQGWHVPTDLQWREMLYDLCEADNCDVEWLQGAPEAAAMGTDEGGKIKTTSYWDSPNVGATNSSGLSVLPGGYRYFDGNYYTFGIYTNIWSSTMHPDGINIWFWAPQNDHADIFHSYGDPNNGQSIRCMRDAATGMDDLQRTQLTVHPNPAQDVLHLSFARSGTHRTIMCNSLGKVVMDETRTSPNYAIDVVELPDGIYFIEVRSDNNVQTVRWVKN